MLVFFTVLIPKNKLAVIPTKKENDDAIKMIKMLHISDHKRLEYSYGIAWERFYQTKGLKNKCIFLYNAAMDDGKGNRKFSFGRLMHLTGNSIGMLFRKLRDKS